MQINSPLKKGFALAVIVLFVGVSAIPLAGTKIVEKSSISVFNDIAYIGVEPTVVSIQPSAQTVEKGEWFDVGIYVEPSEPIMGVGVDIYFDPTLIQAYWVFEGCDLFPPEWYLYFYPGTIDNINGTITGIMGLVFSFYAVSDPGYFANITFLAQQEIGTSPLDLQNVLIADIYGRPLPSTVIDGEVNVGEEPPQITNVMLITSDPLDTDPPFGWENITCTVTDDICVDEVKFIWRRYGQYTEVPMMSEGDYYYYNTTFTHPGTYTYYIWANDTSGNENVSEQNTFRLPSNCDVDMNGIVHFMDIIAVALRHGETGPPGWIREDINNDGIVNLLDLCWVSIHYNEEW